MLGENPYLLFLVLLAAAAGGFWAARRIGRSHNRQEQPRSSVNLDYFKGLNYLLNEQPDKAIEVFIRMAEIDNETVETHFALGNLFRRRGEVDRAIRVHQNIIARPNLAKSQRDQALFALAEDYQKAGLFDRAEKLFLQLCAVPGQRQRAMNALVRIYEQQKDWAQAIEVRRKLGSLAAENDGGIAHAYCELAEQAFSSGDLDGARQYLRKARVNGTQLTRSAYMRATVAEQQNDHRAVIKLCRSIIEQDESFVIEVFPLFMRALEASGGEDQITKTINNLIKKNPTAYRGFALGALTHEHYAASVIKDCLRRYIREEPFAAQLAAALVGTDHVDSATLDDDQLLKISIILSELIHNRSRYECHECGYSGNVLYWQCPGCKDWDSTRPIMRLIGNSARLAT